MADDPHATGSRVATIHAMPWAIVAYPRRFRIRPWRRTEGEGVPVAGYLCHRYLTEHEAQTMRGDLERYWPGARLKVEYRP